MAVFGIVSSTNLLCPVLALAFPQCGEAEFKNLGFIDFLQITFKKDILTLIWYI